MPFDNADEWYPPRGPNPLNWGSLGGHSISTLGAAHLRAGSIAMMGTGATWNTANAMRVARVWNPKAFTATHWFWYNGSAVSGNVKAALWSGTSLELIADSGSVAQSGTTQPQLSADTVLVPQGPLYLGLAMDNTTARMALMGTSVSFVDDGPMQNYATYLSSFTTPPDPLSGGSFTDAAFQNGFLVGLIDRIY